MAKGVIPKQDLRHEDGSISFLKNKLYYFKNSYFNVSKQSDLMNIHLTNEQGQLHRIGNWYKHFKIVY